MADIKYHMGCIAKQANERIANAKYRLKKPDSATEHQDRLSQIQLEIHRLLIEAGSIADENNQVLETDIRTIYLNSADHAGANAVLECNLTLLEK